MIRFSFPRFTTKIQTQFEIIYDVALELFWVCKIARKVEIRRCDKSLSSSLHLPLLEKSQCSSQVIPIASDTGCFCLALKYVSYSKHIFSHFPSTKRESQKMRNPKLSNKMLSLPFHRKRKWHGARGGMEYFRNVALKNEKVSLLHFDPRSEIVCANN